MHVTAQFCSKTRLGDEIAHRKLALHSGFMAILGLDPWGTNPAHIQSVNTHTDSDFAFLVPQMIYLLDRNQIISRSVNKSERHPALSEIAKFISLSICLTDVCLTDDLTEHLTEELASLKTENSDTLRDVTEELASLKTEKRHSARFC